MRVTVAFAVENESVGQVCERGVGLVNRGVCCWGKVGMSGNIGHGVKKYRAENKASGTDALAICSSTASPELFCG